MGNNMANTGLDHFCTASFNKKTSPHSFWEMKVIWDSKLPHDHEFIQQEKYIIHNRWKSQPAFLGSAPFPLLNQHCILHVLMKSQLAL